MGFTCSSIFVQGNFVLEYVVTTPNNETTVLILIEEIRILLMGI